MSGVFLTLTPDGHPTPYKGVSGPVSGQGVRGGDEDGVSELRLVLPGYVPDSRLSLNGRHRTHWAVTSRLRHEAAWHLVAALLRTEDEGDRWLAQLRADAVVGVDVTFVYGVRRRRDPDGLAAMATPLLNMLVAHGLLWDDDSEHVELAVRAVVERGVTETRLTLRAAERGS